MLSKLHNKSFEAIGTQWQITTLLQLDGELYHAILTRIAEFDQTYSRFKADSLVSNIAKRAGQYSFPQGAAELFAFYKQLYNLTNHSVTPLIGATLERAGYDATYSFIEQAQQPIDDWDDVIVWNGLQLTAQKPVLLDVGAAGKGYLVDCIAQVLDQHMIHDYIIDASGDMRHKGIIENIVGLEHPTEPGSVIGTISVVNKSLCASASNRRVWGNNNTMHHIFNPHTQKPTHEIIATWVIADSTMQADGLATALFFTDPAMLRGHFVFEYVRVHNNGSIDYSKAFEGHLF